MRSIILLVAVLAFGGCQRSDHAQKVLEDSGYTNIKMTGYSIFGCSEDDMFHDGFEATGPNGHVLSGVVCSGVLKGSTIRIN